MKTTIDKQNPNYAWMRNELYCQHSVGHGPHVHGCCHQNCCFKAEFAVEFNLARHAALKEVFGKNYDAKKVDRLMPLRKTEVG